MLTGKEHEDFQEYCMKRFGYTDIWTIYTKIEHDFLSQYMDIDEKPKALAIGTLAEKERINTLRGQVEAMDKHYNENADECWRMRESSNGKIW